ncbi:hypothetical protein NGM10_12045 [Halorussus salilacus]|uniref:hypothetical protein n=1 Tax=Halorussus salilacus TaxID=2953750 RepID=UPI00209C833D|nr:hypothetical protein [Halorussus salilacus]USZ67456.1 hypothetical protein NGM10_12045 [Halorussus salilacus]
MKDRRVRQYSWRDVAVAGSLVGVGICLGVVLNAVGLVPPNSRIGVGNAGVIENLGSWSGSKWENATSTALDPNPEHTLRLIQAIGILLPLFTGLIRFTTDEQSSVDDRVSDFLLLGVLALVFAGLFAVIGGITSDTAAILKLSLVLVLFTLTMIGFVALSMVGEMTDGSEGEQFETEPTDSEETGSEGEPTRSDSDREGSEPEPSNCESEGETKPEAAEEPAADDSGETTDDS